MNKKIIMYTTILAAMQLSCIFFASEAQSTANKAEFDLCATPKIINNAGIPIKTSIICEGQQTQCINTSQGSFFWELPWCYRSEQITLAPGESKQINIPLVHDHILLNNKYNAIEIQPNELTHRCTIKNKTFRIKNINSSTAWARPMKIEIIIILSDNNFKATIKTE